MKWTKNLGVAAALLSCWGFVAPQVAFAAQPARGVADTSQAVDALVARDVALQDGGVLHGRVVDAQGAARAHAQISLTRNQQAVATVTTDQRGEFVVRNLKAGVYQVETQQAGNVYRLWAPRTAPPAAGQVALVVDSPLVVRGQGQSCLRYLANPWVLGGLVAAAIAIPLALDDDAS